MCINVYRLAIATFMFTMITNAYAKESVIWPAQEFKVIHDDPRLFKFYKGKSIKSKDIIAEEYLKKVAKYYQKLGFRKPDLEIVVDKKIPKYKVYFSDIEEASGTGRRLAVTNSNDDAPGEIIYDTSVIYDRVGLSAEGYITLGHELFHAIQYSYELKNKNYLGNWIVEGTAQAIGFDMAFRFAPKFVKKTKPSTSKLFFPTVRWGGRDYVRALRTSHASNNDSDESGDSYQTASLWRYIAEYIASKGVPSLSKPTTPPEYGYLADFFENNLTGSKSDEDKELTWLDSNLKQHSSIQKPLSIMFSNFISMQAHFISGRSSEYEQYKKYSDTASRKMWLQALFNSCAVIPLSGTSTSGSTTELNFKKVSAHCIKITYPKSITLDLTIDIQSSDEKVIKSIKNIGIKTKNNKIKVFASTDERLPDGTFFGEWTIQNVVFQTKHRYGENAVVLIISNIAEFASQTAESPSVKFKVKYPKAQANLQLSK